MEFFPLELVFKKNKNVLLIHKCILKIIESTLEGSFKVGRSGKNDYFASYALLRSMFS